jgi:ABC-type multidrug transport system fused ATPase/permease subunit
LPRFKHIQIRLVVRLAETRTVCLFAHGLLLFLAVADMGENWSVGQKQLLCFGRVILKRSRILFMDEATASVDSQTDAAIQKIIREEFAECTVISVAHRIPTVMDSDRVLVLDAGSARFALASFPLLYSLS